MSKTEYKWVKLLGFKAGLRYFRDVLTDKVAVADNSGRYPDTTEDGVLWLNLDAAVTIELGSRDSRVTVPVKSERGKGAGYYCGEEISHLGEFLPLWTSLGGKVELRGDVNADVLQLLLEHVTRPLQKKCAKCDHFLPPGMVSGCHLIKTAGKEIPCFGPKEAATAKDVRQAEINPQYVCNCSGYDSAHEKSCPRYGHDAKQEPTHADGTIDHGWKVPAVAEAPKGDHERASSSSLGRELARAVQELTLPPSVRVLANRVLAQGNARMEPLPRLTSVYIDARDEVVAARERLLKAYESHDGGMTELEELGRDLAVAVGAERTAIAVLAEASALLLSGK